MMSRLIDALFPHQMKADQTELDFWQAHWESRINDYQAHREIFEIRDAWDAACNEALHRHYQAFIGEFKGKHIVECGSGSSYESALMAREGANVTVIDYSDVALQYARIVARRVGSGSTMNFIKEDMLTWKHTLRYDVAWNCGVVEHYPKESAIEFISRMKDICRPGGTVLVTVPNLLSPQALYWMMTQGKTSERFLTRGMLKQYMREAGLRNVSVQVFPFWAPAWVGAEKAVRLSQQNWTRYVPGLAWLFTAKGTV